jgi:[ribosomal protein S18]-alanine N-acetyltransferase
MIDRKIAIDADDIVVHVQPMRRRHVRAVLRIETQVYPRPWSAALFQSELALRETRAYYVARVGHQVVGYGGLMMTLDDGHVTTLAVDPAWHRLRVGTRLLLTLAREAIARGATALTLEVRLSNAAAQALYRRFGFEAVGVRRGYYQDTGEDALVMWARDVREHGYAELLASHERMLPGRTVFETRRPNGSRP